MSGHGVGGGPRSEQPSGGGGQVDVPRKGPANRLDLDDLELSGLGVGPVDRDAVMPSVGGIDEASVRMDEDHGRGVEGLTVLDLFA